MVPAPSISPLDTVFDPFLFSSIGRQENGMPLSVASALARLGSDPWTEAERLAKLPREKATEALSALILKTSPARMKAGDAAGMAARLMLLLPGRTDMPLPRRPKAAVSPRGWVVSLLILLGVAYLVFASFDVMSNRWSASDGTTAVDGTSAN